MTGLRPDGRPWVWDDPDLPVDRFVAEYRRLRPESHLSETEVRDRWRHGTRIDSGGRLHHYPGATKSWGEAMEGAEPGIILDGMILDGVTLRALNRRVDDILALLAELDAELDKVESGAGLVDAVHERLVIEVTALKREIDLNARKGEP